MTEPTTPNVPAPDDSDKLVLSAPDDAQSPKDFLLWAGVLALAILTAFSPALQGRFVWDDNRHVSENSNLRSAEGLARIWFKPGATPQYYPLTHSTYWLEYQLAARSENDINPLLF